MRQRKEEKRKFGQAIAIACVTQRRQERAGYDALTRELTNLTRSAESLADTTVGGSAPSRRIPESMPSG